MSIREPVIRHTERGAAEAPAIDGKANGRSVLGERATGLDSLSPFRVDWANGEPIESPVHVGIVHVGATICHICAATSGDRLARRLGEYVRENAGYQLCSGDAERVLGLLREDRVREAVDLYFGSADQRWGRERLVVRRVPFQGEPRNGR